MIYNAYNDDGITAPVSKHWFRIYDFCPARRIRNMQWALSLRTLPEMDFFKSKVQIDLTQAFLDVEGMVSYKEAI